MTDHTQKTLTGHTPGKWEVIRFDMEEDDEAVIEVYGPHHTIAGNIPVRTCIATVDGSNDAEAEANAELIASAPALEAFTLAYVERIEDYLDGDGECPICETCGEFCEDEDCTTLHVKHPDDCHYVMACEALGKPVKEACGQ